MQAGASAWVEKGGDLDALLDVLWGSAPEQREPTDAQVLGSGSPPAE